MNGIGQSQFDDFLIFSDLYLLQINFRGNLTSIRPKNRSFLGWTSTNFHLFNFTEHFLEPNHLSLKLFMDMVSSREYTLDYFLWKSPEDRISFPLATFVRLITTERNQKNFTFFIKDPRQSEKIPIPYRDKRYHFQARVLPGLIHNLNGPFGTITGRIELLQYKHPQIKEFDDLVRVGYRIQSLIDNVSYKIVHENSPEKRKVNLNRLLREERTFLNCDLFFKHQVEKVDELGNDIPEFEAEYLAISGLFSELYHFFRQFIDEHGEYVFILKSHLTGSQITWGVDFLGEFKTGNSDFAELPFQFEGDYIEMMRYVRAGLDNHFLAHCMRSLNGTLHLSGNQDALKYRFEFALPPASI